MTATTTPSISQGLVPQFVADRLPFTTATSSLRGTKSLAFSGYGRLPEEFQDDLAHNYDHDDFYVVMSYGTPIAWYANGVWSMPRVKYSVTTSKHQSIVKRGIPA